MGDGRGKDGRMKEMFIQYILFTVIWRRDWQRPFRQLTPLHEPLFSVSSKGSVICTNPQTGLHIPRPFYTSTGALDETIKSSMGPP